MPKELKNITEEVMDQINEGKIKMHSKMYFIVGTFLTLFGLIVSVITSVFIISLMRFSFRSVGPMGGYRIQHMITSFPWWLSVLAIFGLVVGILLIRRYNFSYKIDFKIVVALFILTIIISGLVIDMIGVNDRLYRKGPMKGMMKAHFQDHNVRPGISR